MAADATIGPLTNLPFRPPTMIGLIQRVSSASIEIDGKAGARIGPGIVVLVGFRRDDEAKRLDRFIERLLNFRLFRDDNGRMNRSLRDTGGGLLVVPQFTLAADTDSGNRPSFTPAAPPEAGRELFDHLRRRIETAWPGTVYGEFGADMQVALVNDGPVTFWLEV